MASRVASPLDAHLAQLEDVQRRLEEIARAVSTEHEGLSAYARALAGAASARRSATAARRRELGLGEYQGRPLLTVSRSLAALAAEGAISAAALHATAHREFDSQGDANTADLAEGQLIAHLRELESLLDLVSDLVVHELTAVGEECRCRCPACSLGLCLCSSHGTNTIRQARGATGSEPLGVGLRVRRPRRESPIAGAGISEGERILSIDSTAIMNDLDTAAVQNAIRARGAGDELILRVAGTGGTIREVRARKA